MTLRSECGDLNGCSVGVENDCPILRRRKPLDAHRAIALDDDWCGMAETVAAAGAEDHGSRMRASDEFRSARRRAAVMRRLEDDDRRGLEMAQDAGLSFASNISWQDDGHIPEPHREHDRVVVPDALTLPFGRRRMQRANLDLAKAQ